MKAVTFCDNSRYWVQRIVQGETCDPEWGGLKWSHGGTFWAPKGDKFCVGTRDGGDTPLSMALPETRCAKDPFKHQFTFGTEHYAHLFGSFTLCIGRKDSASKIAVDPHCDSEGFDRLLRFRVRLSKASGGKGQNFCVVEGDNGDEIHTECPSGSGLSFNLPDVSAASSYKLVCSGPGLADPAQHIVGIGEECEEGPGKTVNVKHSFKATALEDVAASTPYAGGQGGYPLYTLVDEDVSCQGLFCNNVVACAGRENPTQPCPITSS